MDSLRPTKSSNFDVNIIVMNEVNSISCVYMSMYVNEINTMQDDSHTPQQQCPGVVLHCQDARMIWSLRLVAGLPSHSMCTHVFWIQNNNDIIMSGIDWRQTIFILLEKNCNTTSKFTKMLQLWLQINHWWCPYNYFKFAIL